MDSLSALRQGLEQIGRHGFDVLHAQDCIAGRAVVALRDAGVPALAVRTVHHVDDFTTQALVERQRRSILDPDRVIVVSQYWRRRLQDEFGVHAEVVTNGVSLQRCQRPRGFDPAALRASVGATGRTLFLTVGGIEPRKGTRELVEAMAMLRGPGPGTAPGDRGRALIPGLPPVRGIGPGSGPSPWAWRRERIS